MHINLLYLKGIYTSKETKRKASYIMDYFKKDYEKMLTVLIEENDLFYIIKTKNGRKIIKFYKQEATQAYKNRILKEFTEKALNKIYEEYIIKEDPCYVSSKEFIEKIKINYLIPDNVKIKEKMNMNKNSCISVKNLKDLEFYKINIDELKDFNILFIKNKILYEKLLDYCLEYNIKIVGLKEKIEKNNIKYKNNTLEGVFKKERNEINKKIEKLNEKLNKFKENGDIDKINKIIEYSKNI